jgi:hypothetical protein
MADIRVSTYQGSPTTVLTTQLNSLANLTWSALSSAVDNSTNGYMYVDIEVVLASLTPTGDDAAIEIYLVPSIDGSTYPNYTESGTSEEIENAPYFVGAVPLSLDTEAQTQVLRQIELPPGSFKIGVRNQANVGLAASGNTVRLAYWTYKSV